MGDGGLAIADIGNPFESRWLSTTTTDGCVIDLAVNQKQIWLLDALQGILLYDISNSEQPLQLARLNIKAHAIALAGDDLIVSSDDGLHRYTVDANNVVKEMSLLNIKGGAQKLLVSDNALYTSQGNKLMVVGLDKSGMKLQKQLTLKAPITAITQQRKELLISSEYEVTQLDPTTLKAVNRYPMLNSVSRMNLHEGVLYMSGATTITALRPLPEISFKHDGGNSFTLPATTAIGSYHLRVTYSDGKQQQLDNALHVEMPKFSKPKMTLEEFKKLLEEKRKNSDLFTAPKQ